MNDKTKKIIIIALASAFTVLFIWAAISTVCSTVYRTKYNQVVEQYRLELDESRKRNEQYAEVYRAARETNRAVGESIQRCQSSITELRATLQLIRERYQEMESLLSSSFRGDDFNGWSFDSVDNNTSDEINDTD